MAQLHSLVGYARAISPAVLIGILVGVWVLYQALQYLRDPLRSIPGPFLARFTRLWYLLAVRSGHFEKINVALHKKHGAVVRIAPHYYSIDDMDAIKVIYGHGTNFVKVGESSLPRGQTD